MDVDTTDETETESRTELDSHANMPVVGKHAYIIADTGRIADVNPFTPDYTSMQVPIVDAATQYDCPYNGKAYILLIRNALHVLSMNNDPSFCDEGSWSGRQGHTKDTMHNADGTRPCDHFSGNRLPYTIIVVQSILIFPNGKANDGYGEQLRRGLCHYP
jgi:hypothetical protein